MQGEIIWKEAQTTSLVWSDVGPQENLAVSDSCEFVEIFSCMGLGEGVQGSAVEECWFPTKGRVCTVN